MQLNPLAEFKAHPRHAQAVAFSNDGSELVTTGMDAVAHVWSVPEFESLRTMESHEKSVNAVDLSPDGRLAITGSTDRKVMVWEWDSCEVLHTMGGYRNTVAAAAFSPTGDVAVTSSYDGKIGFWDNGSDTMDVITSHPRNVTSVSFSPDGDMLATAGLGNVVKVWNMETREVQNEFEAPGQAATNCLFLPDGTLCCLTYEGRIAIYTSESHELRSEGSFDDALSGSAALIPGTNSLFCSVRGGVMVIDLDSMTTSVQVNTRIKGMYGVAVSQDGRLASVVSADGKCRVWEIVD